MKKSKAKTIALFISLAFVFGGGMYALNAVSAQTATADGTAKEPIPVFDVPAINKPYETWAEIGVNLEAIDAYFPYEIEIRYENSNVYIEDIGAGGADFTCDGVFFKGITLTDGFWTAEIGEAPTNYAYAYLSARDGDFEWNVTYSKAGKRDPYVRIRNNAADVEISFATTSDIAMVTYIAGDNYYEDEYIGGVLNMHNVESYSDPELINRVSYNPDGSVRHCTLYTDTYYYYFPGQGWSSTWVEFVEGAAPAGYEDKDERYFTEKNPPRFCLHEEKSDATCEEPQICKDCGEAVGDPLGHSYKIDEIITPSTCVVPGLATYVCKNDSSHTYTDEYLDNNAHTWVGSVCKDCGVSCEHNFVGNDKICDDCGAENVSGKYAVALTMGEETTYHATFQEAFDLAEETDPADGAEIVLLKDTEGTTDWIYVDLTVDLAGYTLNNASMPLARGDGEGVRLVINDSSEEGTGRINTFPGIMLCSVEKGEIIINGGTISSLSIGSRENGQVSVVINGGYFEDSTFDLRGKNSTSKVEIYGGAFEMLYALPNENGNGVIEIKGGVYKWICGFEDTFTLSEIMGENYILVDEEYKGADLDANQLYSQYWVTAEYHPTHSYNYYYSDETGHIVTCYCGETDPSSTLESHEFEEYKDNEVHGSMCTVCEYKENIEEHKWDKGTCTVCEHEHFCKEYGTDHICVVCGATGSEDDYAIAAEFNGAFIHYTNFSYAIKNVPEGATLTLLQDVYTSAEDVHIDKEIVLDLNGKTIEKVSSERIYVQAYITIKDSVGGGKITQGLHIETLCVLEGGEFTWISVEAEGVKASDLLARNRQFCVENDEGENVFVTDEQISNYYNVKVVNACTHEVGVVYKDDTAHWIECACGYKSKKEEHSFGEWTETKSPTTSEKGEKTRSCECGHTETEEIDVLKNPDGCGSVVGVSSALIIIGAAAVALTFRKRKED